LVNDCNPILCPTHDVQARRSGGLGLLAHLEMDAAAALDAVAAALDIDDEREAPPRSRVV